MWVSGRVRYERLGDHMTRRLTIIVDFNGKYSDSEDRLFNEFKILLSKMSGEQTIGRSIVRIEELTKENT